MVPSLLSLVLLGGCQPDTSPAWALDPIWFEARDTGIHGYQSWLIYQDRWERKQQDRFFLCSVVVEFDGSPSPCDDCDVAWRVDPRVTDGDCPSAMMDDPLFTRLEQIGLRRADDGFDTPHPGQTSTGYADYGWGWEIHGMAWPATLDHGGHTPDAAWSGEEPFTLSPVLAWPL